MAQCFAAYIPIVREAKVIMVGSSGREKEQAADVFGAISMLEPGDELFLMMGSTNSSAALAAFQKGVMVHQVPHSRAEPILIQEVREEDGRDNNRTKISSREVRYLAQAHPNVFYSVSDAQTEVLKIMEAWDEFADAMKVRKAYASRARARIQRSAVISGEALGRKIGSRRELEDVVRESIGVTDAVGRRRVPKDGMLQALLKDEQRAGRKLDAVMRRSGLFNHVFGSVDGVGTRLAARMIVAIERIDRFKRPKDLSNFGGFLPRGPSGKLPSRKRGQSIGRKPGLNTAGFLTQERLFGYSRNTELGQMLIEMAQRDCPCTVEQRKADVALRRRYAGAVKKARIAVTRHLLEKIVWPRWREYMGLVASSP